MASGSPSLPLYLQSESGKCYFRELILLPFCEVTLGGDVLALGLANVMYFYEVHYCHVLILLQTSFYVIIKSTTSCFVSVINMHGAVRTC